jgi:uncharacterized surface protein with fasciclin (FAS1) repeats
MSPRVLGAAAAAAIGLAASGCGGGGTSSADRAPAHAPASQSVAAGSPLADTHGVVGAGCDRIARTSPGSIGGMATTPVATAAAHNLMLTDFANAIKATGLAGRLNSAKAITVFAPEDSAFAALGHGNLTTLLASRSDLTKVVQYHVVSGRQTPADLASGKHLTTLLGTVIVPAKSRSEYRVNNAAVVCGNIQTANATIYIVNKVLVPIP